MQKPALKLDLHLYFPQLQVCMVLKVVDETCPVEELKPQSPYAEYKLKSEQMLQEMGNKAGLNFVTCRFGTIFGTSIGMRFHTAVNKFCWQAVMGKPITVWKTAWNQKRPYLGLNNAIQLIDILINKKIFDREIYNIVTKNMTVNEIIEIIKKYKRNKIENVESKIMNQLSYEVSFEKIIKHGFVPNDKMEILIKETIKLN